MASRTFYTIWCALTDATALKDAMPYMTAHQIYDSEGLDVSKLFERLSIADGLKLFPEDTINLVSTTTLQGSFVLSISCKSCL